MKNMPPDETAYFMISDGRVLVDIDSVVNLVRHGAKLAEKSSTQKVFDALQEDLLAAKTKLSTFALKHPELILRGGATLDATDFEVSK